MRRADAERAVGQRDGEANMKMRGGGYGREMNQITMYGKFALRHPLVINTRYIFCLTSAIRDLRGGTVDPRGPNESPGAGTGIDQL